MCVDLAARSNMQMSSVEGASSPGKGASGQGMGFSTAAFACGLLQLLATQPWRLWLGVAPAAVVHWTWTAVPAVALCMLSLGVWLLWLSTEVLASASVPTAHRARVLLGSLVLSTVAVSIWQPLGDFLLVQQTALPFLQAMCLAALQEYSGNRWAWNAVFLAAQAVQVARIAAADYAQLAASATAGNAARGYDLTGGAADVSSVLLCRAVGWPNAALPACWADVVHTPSTASIAYNNDPSRAASTMSAEYFAPSTLAYSSQQQQPLRPSTPSTLDTDALISSLLALAALLAAPLLSKLISQPQPPQPPGDARARSEAAGEAGGPRGARAWWRPAEVLLLASVDESVLADPFKEFLLASQSPRKMHLPARGMAEGNYMDITLHDRLLSLWDAPPASHSPLLCPLQARRSKLLCHTLDALSWLLISAASAHHFFSTAYPTMSHAPTTPPATPPATDGAAQQLEIGLTLLFASLLMACSAVALLVFEAAVTSRAVPGSEDRGGMVGGVAGGRGAHRRDGGRPVSQPSPAMLVSLSGKVCLLLITLWACNGLRLTEGAETLITAVEGVQRPHVLLYVGLAVSMVSVGVLADTVGWWLTQIIGVPVLLAAALSPLHTQPIAALPRAVLEQAASLAILSLAPITRLACYWVASIAIAATPPSPTAAVPASHEVSDTPESLSGFITPRSQPQTSQPLPPLTAAAATTRGASTRAGSRPSSSLHSMTSSPLPQSPASGMTAAYAAARGGAAAAAAAAALAPAFSADAAAAALAADAADDGLQRTVSAASRLFAGLQSVSSGGGGSRKGLSPELQSLMDDAEGYDELLARASRQSAQRWAAEGSNSGVLPKLMPGYVQHHAPSPPMPPTSPMQGTQHTNPLVNTALRPLQTAASAPVPAAHAAAATQPPLASRQSHTPTPTQQSPRLSNNNNNNNNMSNNNNNNTTRSGTGLSEVYTSRYSSTGFQAGSPVTGSGGVGGWPAMTVGGVPIAPRASPPHWSAATQNGGTASSMRSYAARPNRSNSLIQASQASQGYSTNPSVGGSGLTTSQAPVTGRTSGSGAVRRVVDATAMAIDAARAQTDSVNVLPPAIPPTTAPATTKPAASNASSRSASNRFSVSSGSTSASSVGHRVSGGWAGANSSQVFIKRGPYTSRAQGVNDVFPEPSQGAGLAPAAQAAAAGSAPLVCWRQAVDAMAAPSAVGMLGEAVAGSLSGSDGFSHPPGSVLSGGRSSAPVGLRGSGSASSQFTYRAARRGGTGARSSWDSWGYARGGAGGAGGVTSLSTGAGSRTAASALASIPEGAALAPGQTDAGPRVWAMPANALTGLKPPSRSGRHRYNPLPPMQPLSSGTLSASMSMTSGGTGSGAYTMYSGGVGASLSQAAAELTHVGKAGAPPLPAFDSSGNASTWLHSSKNVVSTHGGTPLIVATTLHSTIGKGDSASSVQSVGGGAGGAVSDLGVMGNGGGAGFRLIRHADAIRAVSATPAAAAAAAAPPHASPQDSANSTGNAPTAAAQPRRSTAPSDDRAAAAASSLGRHAGAASAPLRTGRSSAPAASLKDSGSSAGKPRGLFNAMAELDRIRHAASSVT